MGDLVFMPKTNPEQKWGCCLILLNSNNEVLMGMRCKEEDLPQWSFPGGSVELGETPCEAAFRETFEETGLICMDINYVEVFKMNDVFDYVFYGNEDYCAGTMRPAPREFSILKWIPLDEVRAMTDNIFPYSKKALELLEQYSPPRY